jgi:hypothetical protein
MITKQETFTISPCPLCTGSHDYTLVVKRATALGMTKKEIGSAPKKITRIFTCPIKSNEFQADLFFQDSSDEMIISVQIGELIKEGVKDESDSQ